MRASAYEQVQPAAALRAVEPVARLLWVALPGPDLDDATAELLRRGAGGVVLFSRNVTGVEQLRQLIAQLRREAAVPLRIAIDQEGGHVARIGAPLTRFPSAMAIGATGSPELAEAVARAAGRELAALGIDVNLAPVVDVALDPRNPSVGARSFGSSPQQVAALGAATVRGYRQAGIAATAKHFPGHGRTPVDSHLALPTIAGGLAALRDDDLPPFRSTIEAGVQLVMISHVAVEDLTDGLPSTLSPAVISQLLRGELGFDGLVVTDAMDMRALADNHPIPEACVRAVAAGADAVIPLDRQQAVLEALAAAVTAGELSPERLGDALRHSDELDVALRSATARRTPVELPNAEHQELARTVARRSLTLLHGDDVLPLGSSTSVAVIEFASRRPSPVEEQLPETPTVGAALKRHLPRLREVVVDAASEMAAGERAAIEAVGGAEFVILATRDAYLWPEERALIERIADVGRPSMLVSLRNPYDLAVLPRTSVAAAVYADVPATLEALAEAICGRAGWPGRLPLDFDGAAAGSAAGSGAPHRPSAERRS